MTRRPARRLPVWLALLPLAAGLGGYYLWWQGEAAAFGKAVAAYAPVTSVGGFPYRIEATLGSVAFARERAGVTLSLSVRQATVNRQPWRTGHVVIAAADPGIDVAVATIAGARLRVSGPGALASVRRPGQILERLSAHFDRAEVELPFAGRFAASDFEVHLRETPTRTGKRTVTGPVQAEARMAGTLSRDDLGFGIELPLFVTDDAPIASLAGWRGGGTLEVRGGRLLTAKGEAVAGFDATLAVLPDGRVAVSGTIDTECPATVTAFLTGGAAATEYRARRSQRLPVSGFADAIEVGAPIGPSGGRARNLEPPCPGLRR